MPSSLGEIERGRPPDELETLWEGGEFVLSRGRRDGDSVLVIAPALEQPSRLTIERLRRAYSVSKELEPGCVARPLEFVRDEGRARLVLEEPPGAVLLQRLIGQPLETKSFLRIALGIAATLDRFHQQGFCHRDIKPAHILVNPATGQTWLIGVGVALRLLRQHQAPQSPDTIAGTLAYMAPEQTGRMNRSTDSRSDLYAFGITLYEMLTGALPFTATDSMEWVHCHIARQPMPPSERADGIAKVLSDIVLKLLAKGPEDRYQTAAGVAFDLRRCLTAWEAHERMDPFPLGTRDVSSRLLIAETLYGRENETKLLLAAFERMVSQGTTELVLVSGYAGVGKSSVVHELHRALVRPRGLFASGKFDQFKRDIPYATFAQAFEGLVHQILSRSDGEVLRWRKAMAEALGPHGQIIVSLIPEVELIIGKQPPVPDLSPQDTKNRFQRVLGLFVGVFARPEHPLALFLDDLQWMDTATLHLLEYLVSESGLRHLLLVGAYRDNEVGLAHPLLRTLENIRLAGTHVEEIVLPPLRLEDVNAFVADSLQVERHKTLPLAQLLDEKTGGNPFFLIQFFSMLADEGHLTFDATTASWTWDVVRIRAKCYTDNVLVLMGKKMSLLPDRTQAVLMRFACMGNAAEAAILATVCEETEEELEATLAEAVEAGLILWHERKYSFLHDRVQEAAYTLLPAQQREAVHLKIGRALASWVRPEDLEENIFEIVNQFNRGVSLIRSPVEREQVVEYNLLAAKRAKVSTAYGAALTYLMAGRSLLEEKSWQDRYQLTFDLERLRVECELLNSNFDVAEGLSVELLQRCESKIDKAAAAQLKIELNVMQSESRRGVDTALACLRLFDIEMSPHPSDDRLDDALALVFHKLNGRPIESLVDLPRAANPDVESAMRILQVLYSPAQCTDETLLYLELCQMVELTLEHGLMAGSAHGLAWFGLVLGHRRGRYAEGYRFAQVAKAIIEKHGFVAETSSVLLALEVTSLWSCPVSSAIDTVRQTFAAAEGSDTLTACFSLGHLVTDLLLRGDHLEEVWLESERGMAFVQSIKFRGVIEVFQFQQRFILNMQGKTASFSTFDGDGFDSARYEASLNPNRFPLTVHWYWVIKGKARFLSGNLDEALLALDKARPLLWSAFGHIQLLDYHFFRALTLAALEKPAPYPPSPAPHREQLHAHSQQLRQWAENYPPTFSDKYALVSAEIARLEGRVVDAMRLYEQAIQLAREHGFVQNEGLAFELAGKFHAGLGLETTNRAHLRAARDCFERWGAHGKVRQLEQCHPEALQEINRSPKWAAIGSIVEHLDTKTVVKASQVISGEIVLSQLIEKLMRIAIENAGAERGLLILFRDGRSQIEAEASTFRDSIHVVVGQAAVTPSQLPESLLHYVIRTRTSVVLDDASGRNLYSDDEYIRRNRPRSVLCVPIVKQLKLVGILYLENNLTPRAFTSDRVALLEMLASQAAISLENAQLYADLEQENAERKRVEDELRRSEELLSEGQQISHTGSWCWNITTGKLIWSAEQLRIFGLPPNDEGMTIDRFVARIHPEDRASVLETIDDAKGLIGPFDHEYRIILPDGSIRYIRGSGRPVVPESGKVEEYIGAVTDFTEQRDAEVVLRKVQAELAQVTRLTTMGELAASIAHEINQPLASIANNASACLLLLPAEAPGDVQDGLNEIVKDAMSASGIISRIRAMARGAPPERTPLRLEEIVADILELSRGQMMEKKVHLETHLPADLPLVRGDKVGLHQVLLNLVVNAIEAMEAVAVDRRMIKIEGRTEQRDGQPVVLMTVRDSGVGFAEGEEDRIFEAFHTTKAKGMGMGLRISRSLIEACGGRLWATSKPGVGSTFSFYLPASAPSHSSEISSTNDA